MPRAGRPSPVAGACGSTVAPGRWECPFVAEKPFRVAGNPPEPRRCRLALGMRVSRTQRRPGVRFPPQGRFFARVAAVTAAAVARCVRFAAFAAGCGCWRSAGAVAVLLPSRFRVPVVSLGARVGAGAGLRARGCGP